MQGSCRVFFDPVIAEGIKHMDSPTVDNPMLVEDFVVFPGGIPSTKTAWDSECVTETELHQSGSRLFIRLSRMYDPLLATDGKIHENIYVTELDKKWTL